MGTTSTSTSPSRVHARGRYAPHMVRVVAFSLALGGSVALLGSSAFAQESPFRPVGAQASVVECPGLVADEWICEGERCSALADTGGRVTARGRVYNALVASCGGTELMLEDVVWQDDDGRTQSAAQVRLARSDLGSGTTPTPTAPVARRAGIRSASIGLRPGVGRRAERVTGRTAALFPVNGHAITLAAEAAPSGPAGTLQLENAEGRTLRLDAGSIRGNARWMLLGSARLGSPNARLWVDADRAGRDSRPYFAGTSATSLRGGEFAQGGLAFHHGPMWGRLSMTDRRASVQDASIVTTVDADIGIRLSDGVFSWEVESAAQHRAERIPGAPDDVGVGAATRAGGRLFAQHGLLTGGASLALHTSAWSERSALGEDTAMRERTASETAIVPSMEVGLRPRRAEWSVWFGAPVSLLADEGGADSPWAPPSADLSGSMQLRWFVALGRRATLVWTSVGRVEGGEPARFRHRVSVGTEAFDLWVETAHSVSDVVRVLGGIAVGTEAVAWRVLGDAQWTSQAVPTALHGTLPLRAPDLLGREGSGLRSEWVARISAVRGELAVDLWDDRGPALGYHAVLGWDATAGRWGIALTTGQPVGHRSPYAMLSVRTGNHLDAPFRGLRSPIHLR